MDPLVAAVGTEKIITSYEWNEIHLYKANTGKQVVLMELVMNRTYR